jgi:hypothetical protein
VNSGSFDFSSSFQVPSVTMKQPSASALVANKPMANATDAGGEDFDVNGEHLDELENRRQMGPSRGTLGEGQTTSQPRV